MLEVVLKLCKESADREGMADVLVIQGTAAFYRGELYRAQAYCEESMALYVELGDTFGTALNLLTLGWIAYCKGEYVNAHRLTEESLEQFRILGNYSLKLEARTFLAFTEAALGEVAKASKLLEEVLVRGREQDHQDVAAQALWALGKLAQKQNNLKRASTLFREGLASMTGRMIHMRFKWIIAACLEGLGEIALVQGQPACTTWLYGAADAFRTVQNYCNPLGIEQPNYEHTLVEARKQLGEETFAALRDEGKRMTPEQALEAEGRTSLQKQASKEIIAPTAAKHQLVVSSPSSMLQELLTLREIDVIRLVAEGLTNKQIAERLVISPSTVDTHIQSIYNRLGISSRSAATRYAIEHHFL